VLCELSLCNFFAWMLGYVDFNWFALELCDFFSKTTISDSLTVGSPSNLDCRFKTLFGSFVHWDLQNNIWSVRYDLCTKIVKYARVGIFTEIAQSSYSWANSPKRAKFHPNESCRLQIHPEATSVFLASSPPTP